MSETLYRKVDVANPPKKFGFYACLFNDGTIMTQSFGGGKFHSNITHWLEEVTLPTDEEIQKQSKDYAYGVDSDGNEHWNLTEENAHKQGANWVKKLILGNEE